MSVHDVDLVASLLGPKTGGKNTQDGVLEGLQAEVEQISGRAEVLEGQLGDVDKEVEETEAAILALKRAKAARTGGRGHVGASQHMARQQAVQVRLKEDLLARLKMQENTLAHAMGLARSRIDALRGEARERGRRFDLLVSSLNQVKAEMVGHLARSNEALAGRNAAADALKRARAEDAAARARYGAQAEALRSKISASHAATVAEARASAARNSGTSRGAPGKGGAGARPGGGGKGPAAAAAAAAEDAGGGPGSGNLTEEQEEAARSAITRLDGLITEHEAIIAEQHRQTSQLQEVFRTMIGQAGLQSLDQLVERFAEAEAHKYEMYGYVTHTGSETAAYDEMLRETRQAQAEYVAELAAAARAQRAALGSMRGELAALRAQAGAVHARRAAAHSTVRRLVLELLRVYAAVGGDDASRLSLLVPGAGLGGSGGGAGGGAGGGGAGWAGGDGPGSLAAGEGEGKTADGPRPSSSSSVSSSVGGGGGGGGGSSALVVGKDEVTAILGDIEQATSDLAIAVTNLLRDRSARGLLADGVEALEGLVEREMKEAARQRRERLMRGSALGDTAGQQREQQQQQRQGGSGGGGDGDRDEKEEAEAEALRASLQRNLSVVRHVRGAVGSLSAYDVDKLRGSLHRQPATPAKATLGRGAAGAGVGAGAMSLGAGSAARVAGVPPALAVAALTTREPLPSAGHHHHHHGHSHGHSHSHLLSLQRGAKGAGAALSPQPRAASAVGGPRSSISSSSAAAAAAGGGASAVASLHRNMSREGGLLLVDGPPPGGSPPMSHSQQQQHQHQHQQQQQHRPMTSPSVISSAGGRRGAAPLVPELQRL